MQDNPVRKARVYKQRACEDCGTLYVPNSSQQVRCGACQQARTLRLGREGKTRSRKAAYEPRYCVDCGAELPPPKRGGRLIQRCEPCNEAHREGYEVARRKARSESGYRRTYNKQWRVANPEKVRESSRRYKQANPEVDLAAIHRRRQRLDHGMDARDREMSVDYRRAIRDDPCFYCGSSAERCHVDHYFPLAKGGTDHWFNLVPACRTCNLRKFTECGTAYLLRLRPAEQAA
jgi:5-methylcytosine-specific restriction endonuclease McrA